MESVLTPVRFFERRIMSNRLRYYWLYRCACGTEVVSIRNSERKSCGCLLGDKTRKRQAQNKRGKSGHGQSWSPTYVTWVSMISRCKYPSHKSYKNYGGRGIKVCDRWKKFSNFYADMGDRQKNMTIDRINVDGDYEPGNCRWATMEEQNQPSARRLLVR